LEIIINDQPVKLLQKDRKIDTEAPAIKINMCDNSAKVIGLMAEKTQVFITVPSFDDIDSNLKNIINEYRKKANIYIIASTQSDNDFDKSMSSIDFENISKKMGVYVNETLCAKSIFIINKDGLIKYIDILPNIKDDFDSNKFEDSLNEVINFKKKGHTHEDWMSV
jgi:thiol peroxidase